MHVPPNELTGIEIVWRMFQVCNMRDIDLKAHIINFLSLIHQSISRLLIDRKTAIYRAFTEQCLARLQAVVSDPALD